MKIADGIHWVGSGCAGLSAEGDCHVYLIEGRDALALVDCGKAKDPALILKNVREDGLDPARIRYCFLTHSHFDHAGGCESLRRMGVSIVGSPIADDILRAGARDYYRLDPEDPQLRPWCETPLSRVDIPIAHGQTFDLGGMKVQALLTPGHSPDSVSFVLTRQSDGTRHAFTGDAVFYRGMISVLAPPFSDLIGFREGLSPLAGLDIQGLFPGHLMWVLKGGQRHIDIAREAFAHGQMPVQKPFS